jgi:ribosome-interacting GTPase 1
VLFIPSNTSVEFEVARTKLEQSKTNEERMIALLEMKSTAPQHKGAEKMRAEINRKISDLRVQIEKQEVQAKKGAVQTMSVKKEGVGQIVIVGTPNTGKSWILNKLVGKEIAQEAPYPFTTKEPVPAMMYHKGAAIQLVELPALVEGSSEGKAQGKEILGLVRNADAVVVCAPPEDRALLENEFKKAFIFLNKTKPPIEVKNSGFIGIQISGKEHLKMTELQLEELLKASGHYNVSVIITGPISTPEEVLESMNEKIVYKPALFLNAKMVEMQHLPIVKQKFVDLLKLVLVYTKKPGSEPDMTAPIGLKQGSTVLDLANSVHKDFANKFKYARMWGSGKFAGQRVGPEYVLAEGDIVEFTI